jgi:hypothetical protein
MKTNQIKLLKELANEIRTAKRSGDEVVISLQPAKILTKQENFTGKFNNLKRVCIFK